MKEQADAFQKPWSMIEKHRFAMFAIWEEPGVLRSRPMTLQEREHDGFLWFFAKCDSAVLQAIRKQSQGWFPQGPEAPDVVLIRVTAQHGEYWDSSSSKLVQLFSIAKAVAGSTTPEGLGEHREVAL